MRIGPNGGKWKLEQFCIDFDDVDGPRFHEKWRCVAPPTQGDAGGDSSTFTATTRDAAASTSAGSGGPGDSQPSTVLQAPTTQGDGGEEPPEEPQAEPEEPRGEEEPPKEPVPEHKKRKVGAHKAPCS